MDHDLRELERKYAAEPNSDNRAALLRARNRINFKPVCSQDLILMQSELKDRYAAINTEIRRTSFDRFNKFLAFIFAEHPGLELATFLCYVPAFMDGDPCRVDGSILVSPHTYCSYGLLSYSDVFENYSVENDKANNLVLRPGIINDKLNKDECEHIAEAFWQFYPSMKYMYGINTRVDFRRQLEEETYPDWYPKGVFWERKSYNTGY